MDTIVYELDGKLYINLTNRCSNDCAFCVRNGKDAYYGNKLWLSKEPTSEEVLGAIDDMDYDEIVFCGFGEPTFRFKELVKVGRELKARGYIVRLDTNGQDNIINGRDITEELATAVDKVNVSLNASSADKYFDLCRPVFGEDAYEALIDFAKKCKARGMYVTFSVVDCIGEEEVEKCREVAKNADIPLKVRAFIKDS